jgi:hypothetical protein
MEEQCALWSPIPLEANRYMAANVQRLEEAQGQRGRAVRMVVTGNPDPVDRERVAAWRLIFFRVAAYRKRPAGTYWPDAVPLLWPEPRGISTWEIKNSRWLPESLPPERRHPGRMRHFVIASSYNVYEIAAETCESEEIGDWQHMRENIRTFTGEASEAH